MKLLISIQCCFPRNDAGLIYVYAWKNFLDKYRNQFDCDFVFTNNGLDPNRFTDLVAPYSCTHVPGHTSHIAWDTDSSWHPFATYNNYYDFILRVDSDAFLTPENIHSFIDFLKQNPDIDFVSASNFCRSITNRSDNTSFGLDTSHCTPLEIKGWEWFPWRYPTHNSDLYIMKSEFFRRCCHAYDVCPFTARPHMPRTPFDAWDLTYGRVCQILDYTETRFEKSYDHELIRIDGSINTDFWTILCSLNPNMAGIVNYDGRSFRIKNHLIQLPLAIAQDVPFKNLIDASDISYPHEKNVVAPYFHTGNGYVTDSFFINNDHYICSGDTVGQLQAGNMTFGVTHFLMVLMLTRSSADEGLLGQIQGTMIPYMEQYQIDPKPLSDGYEKLQSFLQDTLDGYLNLDNINKYSHVIGDI